MTYQPRFTRPKIGRTCHELDLQFSVENSYSSRILDFCPQSSLPFVLEFTLCLFAMAPLPDKRTISPLRTEFEVLDFLVRTNAEDGSVKISKLASDHAMNMMCGTGDPALATLLELNGLRRKDHQVFYLYAFSSLFENFLDKDRVSVIMDSKDLRCPYCFKTYQQPKSLSDHADLCLDNAAHWVKRSFVHSLAVLDKDHKALENADVLLTELERKCSESSGS